MALLDGDPSVLRRFVDLLYAYVVSCDPRALPPDLLPPEDRQLAQVLLRSGELFVMGHEYVHFIWRHLDDKEPATAGAGGPSAERITRSWEHEFEADVAGLGFMYQAARMLDLSYCGADCYLSCSEVFERCLSLLRTAAVAGPLMPRDGAYPPPALRRERLRAWVQEQWGDLANEPMMLARQAQAALDLLWERSLPHWRRLYDSGTRPSPVWK